MDRFTSPGLPWDYMHANGSRARPRYVRIHVKRTETKLSIYETAQCAIICSSSPRACIKQELWYHCESSSSRIGGRRLEMAGRDETDSTTFGHVREDGPSLTKETILKVLKSIDSLKSYVSTIYSKIYLFCRASLICLLELEKKWWLVINCGNGHINTIQVLTMN